MQHEEAKWRHLKKAATGIPRAEPLWRRDLPDSSANAMSAERDWSVIRNPRSNGMTPTFTVRVLSAGSPPATSSSGRSAARATATAPRDHGRRIGATKRAPMTVSISGNLARAAGLEPLPDDDNLPPDHDGLGWRP